MGCFGYICKGCGTQIVGDCYEGGELAKMLHVREGKVLGQTEGHYDEYGRVIEDTLFRNSEEGNPNSHDEICKSEIYLPLSSHAMDRIRQYRGLDVTLTEYETQRLSEKIETRLGKGDKIDELEGIKIPKHILKLLDITEFTPSVDTMNIGELAEYVAGMGASVIMVVNRELHGEIQDEFYELNKTGTKATSGVVAWHKKCYDEATKEAREDLTPSKSDPNQSWGDIRDEYR